MAKTAFVTGGVRGIGAAIAKHLSRDGFEVVVCDVDQDAIDRFSEETGITGVQMDVSDFQNTQDVIDDVEQRFDGIDVLVNNAGITRDGMVHKMEPESQWEAVIKVNLTGVFNTCRMVTPKMRERNYGRVINISSMNGQRGQFGQSNYSAAKAGVIGFTKAIAQELAGKGITANCIAPGFIDTEMTRQMKPEALEAEAAKIPVGRMGTPEDIAAVVSFLASDSASFISGQTLSPNGGQLMV